jgi:hypothetical protein
MIMGCTRALLEAGEGRLNYHADIREAETRDGMFEARFRDRSIIVVSRDPDHDLCDAMIKARSGGRRARQRPARAELGASRELDRSPVSATDGAAWDGTEFLSRVIA